MKKYLDEIGLRHLWSKISMQDYPNNETLIAVINAIDDSKQDAIIGTPGQFLVIGEDGKPVAQTIQFNSYYKGTTAPENSLGQDGDLYLVKG